MLSFVLAVGLFAQPQSAGALLEAGIEEYTRGDFDAALRDLERAAALVEKERAARAYLYLGFTRVALGQEAQAEVEFERALGLDPTIDASSASPKIRELFTRVARRVARPPKDQSPPELRALTVLPVSQGAPLDFLVEATDPSGVGAVRVQYRVRGGKSWGVLPLSAAAPTQFAGSLPPVVAQPPGIEYYVEAWDRHGNGPARMGTPEQPRFVEVKLVPVPPPQHTPFYERWWFWTAIGAATAAGVVVGVSAARTQAIHVTLTTQ